MTLLSTLIEGGIAGAKKCNLGDHATATVATSATVAPVPPPSVATVATVAVAPPRKSPLFETLAPLCRDSDITPREVVDALDEEDITAWQAGEIGPDALAAFIRALTIRRDIERGRRPEHYDQVATCAHCGPVWAWFEGNVWGCPWCRNRLNGGPIPRPERVRCADCARYEREKHPHLGICLAGERGGPAGLWDTTRRACVYWMPRRDRP